MPDYLRPLVYEISDVIKDNDSTSFMYPVFDRNWQHKLSRFDLEFWRDPERIFSRTLPPCVDVVSHVILNPSLSSAMVHGLGCPGGIR